MNSSELTEWLLNLYERLEKDVRLLSEEEPFWKVCHDCTDGYCCQKNAIPVMSMEWDMVTRYVKKTFSNRNKGRLMDNIESKRIWCPFLFSGKCSVYPVRPWSCRIYPYVISFHSSKITFQTGYISLPLCRSLAKSFGIKVGEIAFLAPEILSRHTSGKLVKCSLEKPRPLWYVDATDYFAEYENNMPKNESGVLDGDDMHRWVELPKYLRDIGKISQQKFREVLGLD